MAKFDILVNENNIEEWLHSTGYFLPRNDREELRFEMLFGDEVVKSDINNVNPYAILDGSWAPRIVKDIIDPELENEVHQLRMAARKHEELPEDIIKRLLKNQEDEDVDPDNT